MGGSDGGGGRHGGQTTGRTADSSGSRQDGGQLRQSAGRPAIRQRRQPGGRRRYQTRRPAQEYHAAQAHRRSASHPPPERPALRQPAGRRRYQPPAPAKIPRRAGLREILNAPARGTGGAAVVLCGFGSPKFFLGKGSKNRFRGTGAGKVGGVKNATEEENGAVLGKKEAAYAAACGENGGAVEVGGCIWNGRALACA